MTLRSRDFWFVLALALLVLGIGIGLRDPWPADEPRFVLVAKQMVDSGQYLVPHRGAEIYPDKPPLFMWLLASAHALTGEWRSAFLLPSLLASLGTIALTFDLALKLWVEGGIDDTGRAFTEAAFDLESIDRNGLGRSAK